MSLLLLLVPRLNPATTTASIGVPVPNAAMSTKVVAALVEPTEVDLLRRSGDALGAATARAIGAGKAAGLLRQLPVVAVALMSLVPLVFAGRGQRIRATIVVAPRSASWRTISRYLQGWDYHYIALAPLLPVTLWLWRREHVPGLRRLLMVAFLVSLSLFLPVPLLLPRDDLHWWTPEHFCGPPR